MYASVTFLGINNCSSVLPYIARERTVMYREKFAGMYSPWTYALAQVFSHFGFFFFNNHSGFNSHETFFIFFQDKLSNFWVFYGIQ